MSVDHDKKYTVSSVLELVAACAHAHSLRGMLICVHAYASAAESVRCCGLVHIFA